MIYFGHGFPSPGSPQVTSLPTQLYVISLFPKQKANKTNKTKMPKQN